MSIEGQSSSEEQVVSQEADVSQPETSESSQISEESREATSKESEEVQPKPESVSYAEYEALLNKTQELERQKEDKSKFISEILPKYRETSAEVTKLKAEYESLKSQLPDKDDVWSGEDFQRYQRAQQIEAQALEQETLATEMHNKAILDEYYPEYTENLEDIAAEMLRQGARPDQVEIIKKRPHAFVAEDLPYIKGIINTVRLQKENMALRQQLGHSVTSVKSHMDKVNQVAMGSTLSNSVGETSISLPTSGVDQESFVRGLSDEDLNKLLEEGFKS